MQTTPLNLILLGLFEPETKLRELHVFKKAAEHLDEELAKRALLLDQLYYQGTADDTALEEMLLDYTRLFLSPGTPLAKNYLTCWKTQLGDNILDEYLSFLESKGFEIEKDIKELPEHIVPVLEVYDLLNNEERPEYFEKFLSKFIPHWSALLEAEANHKFYKELGKFFIEWSNLEGEKNGSVS